jgi:hypothetical protein
MVCTVTVPLGPNPSAQLPFPADDLTGQGKGG